MEVVYSYDAICYKYTGKERDSESGLDNFGARYNASSMGRFMSQECGRVREAVAADLRSSLPRRRSQA